MCVKNILRFMNNRVFDKSVLNAAPFIRDVYDLDIILRSAENRINMKKKHNRHIFYKTPKKMRLYEDMPRPEIFYEWILMNNIYSNCEWLELNCKYHFIDIVKWRQHITKCLNFQGLCEYQQYYTAEYNASIEIINYIKYKAVLPLNTPSKFGRIK